MRSARSCVTALIRFTPTRAGSFPVTIRHACIRCGWDSGVCVRRWTCSPRCFPHTPDSTPNCAGLRQNSVRRAIGELAGATLDHAGADSNEQELGPIRRACTQMAVANRKRAATAVESVRYTRLILEFTLWLEVKRWRDAMTDEQRAAIEGSARKFAVEVLHSRHRKLIKRGEACRSGQPPSAPRPYRGEEGSLRDGVFQSLVSKRAVRHYVDALTDLQDDLGWRNDAVVADKLLRIVSRKSTEADRGAAFVRGYLASRVAADHRRLSKVWKHFERISPPH